MCVCVCMCVEKLIVNWTVNFSTYCRIKILYLLSYIYIYIYIYVYILFNFFHECKLSNVCFWFIAKNKYCNLVKIFVLRIFKIVSN